MPLVAGVDCSTQSTKVLVVDTDGGQVVAHGRASHEVTGSDGARETDPAVWQQALASALHQTGRAGDIAALSIGGQQHGLCLLDDARRPLRPAILWNDTRPASDATELREAWGPHRWAEELGVVPVASFTVAKWHWVRRREPAVAAATRAIRLPHDLLTEWLTGEAVTDRSDVSGTGWWSTRDEAYATAVLELPDVDLDPAMLPRVLGATEAAGTVRADVTATLGLPPGCLVAAGAGDNAAAALGLGLRPGTPAVSLGTSGTAYAVSDTRIVDPSGTVAGFAAADDGYLPLAATLNCTLATDRFASWLGLDRNDIAEDSGGVVVLPYLDGERTPDLPHAAGTVLGLRHDTTPQQILRAAYEGAAASLVDALSAIDRRSSGLAPDAPLVVIGGGARGAAWQQVLRATSGRALQVPAQQELVAMGAAAQAAAVLNGTEPHTIAAAWETRGGHAVEAPAAADTAVLDSIRDIRHRAEPVLTDAERGPA